MEPVTLLPARSAPLDLPDTGLAVVEPGRHHRLRLLSPLTLGVVLLGGLLIFLLAGLLLARFSPTAINAGARLAPPDGLHWFGTDALGRDLFSRVVHGFWNSLHICLGAAMIAALPGILLGLVSGFYGGWLDRVLSRAVEVLLSLPGLLLAIVLIARLGSSLTTLMIAIGITGIPTFFRIARNETLSMSKQPFVEAARLVGVRNSRVIFRHILPNIFPTLLVFTTMRMGTFLLMGSGLGFIGLGIKPPAAELGALLASGKDYYQTAWWLFAFPGAVMALAVLGLNVLGEGLRDRFDRC